MPIFKECRIHMCHLDFLGNMEQVVSFTPHLEVRDTFFKVKSGQLHKGNQMCPQRFRCFSSFLMSEKCPSTSHQFDQTLERIHGRGQDIHHCVLHWMGERHCRGFGWSIEKTTPNKRLLQPSSENGKTFPKSYPETLGCWSANLWVSRASHQMISFTWTAL